MAGSQAVAYKKAGIRFFIPPPNPLPPSVETLAILDFSGPDGDKFADSVIRGLLRDEEYDLNGRVLPEMRGFEIVERSRMSNILREQRLATSGVIDEATAAEIGKVAGVDAVFIGEIAHEPTSSRSREGYGSEGRTHVCVKNSTRSQFNGRIIDVDTGEILVVFDIARHSGESKGCGDQKPASHSEQMEMNSIGLMAGIVVELLGSIGYRERELEKIKAKPFKDRAKKAAELTEAGDFAAAFVLYKAIHDEDPYSDQSAYNLAVMHEAVGNYEQAEALYATALNMKPKEKDYINAHEHTSSALKALLKAQEILQFEYPPYEFSIDATDLKKATGVVIKTDGGRDKRHAVYDGVDGTEFVRIPGSLELVLIEDKGEWVRISLPDGKEGWMKSESIDGDSLKDARKE